MAFTYTGDPAASDLEWVRFELGDVTSATAIFTDAEINAVLGEQANKFLAAARLWSNLAARWGTDGKGAVAERISKLQVEYGVSGDGMAALKSRIVELRHLGMPNTSRHFRVVRR